MAKEPIPAALELDLKKWRLRSEKNGGSLRSRRRVVRQLVSRSGDIAGAEPCFFLTNVVPERPGLCGLTLDGAMPGPDGENAGISRDFWFSAVPPTWLA